MNKLILHNCFFKKLFIVVVVVVFFVEFIQNVSAFAGNENQQCIELIEPSNIEELKKLRLCIEKIKISKIENKANQIINNSYKGSINLTARLKNDNKTAKIIPKKL